MELVLGQSEDGYMGKLDMSIGTMSSMKQTMEHYAICSEKFRVMKRKLSTS